MYFQAPNDYTLGPSMYSSYSEKYRMHYVDIANNYKGMYFLIKNP